MLAELLTQRRVQQVGGGVVTLDVLATPGVNLKRHLLPE